MACDLEKSSNAVLTIRVIRSFQHRNIRHFVMKDVNLDLTGEQFLKDVDKALQEQSFPPPIKKYTYDTLKIQHKPHGAKTADPIINRENDEELVLDLTKSLTGNGIVSETELSYFKKEDYLNYKESPSCKWE